jgi:hypothetical protein
MWVLGVMGAFWLGGLDGFFCCFGGSGFVRALLYAACVRRDALNFFNKLQPYLSKKISFIEAQTTKGTPQNFLVNLYDILKKIY